VAVGAMAGGAFGVLFLGLLILAHITARFNGPIYVVATGYWSYGPSPASGLQQALGWGVLGGALGGWLHGSFQGGRASVFRIRGRRPPAGEARPR
jgi:hypothetical protein